jgi:hypothetical protein
MTPIPLTTINPRIITRMATTMKLIIPKMEKAIFCLSCFVFKVLVIGY